MTSEGPTSAGPGSVGGGRYVLGEILGGGGTAVVFAARDRQTGMDVAVKQLRGQFSDDSVVRRRFLTEAEALIHLQHPGVVRLLDVGDDPRPFLVMERITGPTLRAWCDSRGHVSAHTAALIVWRMAEALALAHAHGIIHRDLKPQNVFVCAPIGGPAEGGMGGDDPVPIGAIRIADFGNARVVALASLTGSSTTWGSPEYVAPEVFARGRLDPRADLYSLGVILFELLIGRPPFARGDALARLARVGDREGQGLPPSGAGPGLDRLIGDLVAPRPSDRPPSALAVLARLREAFAPASIQALMTRPQPCAACASLYSPDLPRCPSCGHAPIPLQHHPDGDCRVLLVDVADDVDVTSRLVATIEALTGRPMQGAFLSRASILFSDEERKSGLDLPAVLFAGFDQATARAVASALSGPGVIIEVQRGSDAHVRSRALRARSALAACLPGAISLGLPARLLDLPTWVVVLCTALGVTLFAALGYSAAPLKPNSLTPHFRLRPHATPLPAADHLLTRLIEASQGLRAEEPRALVRDLAAEVYRLAQAAGAQPHAPSGITQRLLAELPGITEHLVGLASRADALDAALDAGSERDLVVAIARLDRQLREASPAEAPVLASTRAAAEAALEQRGKSERDREHLVAELCRLLSELRDLVQRVAALEGTPPHALPGAAAEALQALARIAPVG